MADSTGTRFYRGVEKKETDSPKNQYLDGFKSNQGVGNDFYSDYKAPVKTVTTAPPLPTNVHKYDEQDRLRQIDTWREIYNAQLEYETSMQAYQKPADYKMVARTDPLNPKKQIYVADPKNAQAVKYGTKSEDFGPDKWEGLDLRTQRMKIKAMIAQGLGEFVPISYDKQHPKIVTDPATGQNTTAYNPNAGYIYRRVPVRDPKDSSKFTYMRETEPVAAMTRSGAIVRAKKPGEDPKKWLYKLLGKDIVAEWNKSVDFTGNSDSITPVSEDVVGLMFDDRSFDERAHPAPELAVPKGFVPPTYNLYQGTSPRQQQINKGNEQYTRGGMFTNWTDVVYKALNPFFNYDKAGPSNSILKNPAWVDNPGVMNDTAEGTNPYGAAAWAFGSSLPMLSATGMPGISAQLYGDAASRFPFENPSNVAAETAVNAVALNRLGKWGKTYYKNLPVNTSPTVGTVVKKAATGATILGTVQAGAGEVFKDEAVKEEHKWDAERAANFGKKWAQAVGMVALYDVYPGAKMIFNGRQGKQAAFSLDLRGRPAVDVEAKFDEVGDYVIRGRNVNDYLKDNNLNNLTPKALDAYKSMFQAAESTFKDSDGAKIPRMGVVSQRKGKETVEIPAVVIEDVANIKAGWKKAEQSTGAGVKFGSEDLEPVYADGKGEKSVADENIISPELQALITDLKAGRGGKQGIPQPEGIPTIEELMAQMPADLNVQDRRFQAEAEQKRLIDEQRQQAEPVGPPEPQATPGEQAPPPLPMGPPVMAGTAERGGATPEYFSNKAPTPETSPRPPIERSTDQDMTRTLKLVKPPADMDVTKPEFHDQVARIAEGIDARIRNTEQAVRTIDRVITTGVDQNGNPYRGTPKAIDEAFIKNDIIANEPDTGDITLWEAQVGQILIGNEITTAIQKQHPGMNYHQAVAKRNELFGATVGKNAIENQNNWRSFMMKTPSTSNHPDAPGLIEMIPVVAEKNWIDTWDTIVAKNKKEAQGNEKKATNKKSGEQPADAGTPATEPVKKPTVTPESQPDATEQTLEEMPIIEAKGNQARVEDITPLDKVINQEPAGGTQDKVDMEQVNETPHPEKKGKKSPTKRVTIPNKPPPIRRKGNTEKTQQTDKSEKLDPREAKKAGTKPGKPVVEKAATIPKEKKTTYTKAWDKDGNPISVLSKPNAKKQVGYVIGHDGAVETDFKPKYISVKNVTYKDPKSWEVGDIVSIKDKTGKNNNYEITAKTVPARGQAKYTIKNIAGYPETMSYKGQELVPGKAWTAEEQALAIKKDKAESDAATLADYKKNKTGGAGSNSNTAQNIRVLNDKNKKKNVDKEIQTGTNVTAGGPGTEKKKTDPAEVVAKAEESKKTFKNKLNELQTNPIYGWLALGGYLSFANPVGAYDALYFAPALAHGIIQMAKNSGVKMPNIRYKRKDGRIIKIDMGKPDAKGIAPAVYESEAYKRFEGNLPKDKDGKLTPGGQTALDNEAKRIQGIRDKYNKMKRIAIGSQTNPIAKEIRQKMDKGANVARQRIKPLLKKAQEFSSSYNLKDKAHVWEVGNRIRTGLYKAKNEYNKKLSQREQQENMLNANPDMTKKEAKDVVSQAMAKAKAKYNAKVEALNSPENIKAEAKKVSDEMGGKWKMTDAQINEWYDTVWRDAQELARHSLNIQILAKALRILKIPLQDATSEAMLAQKRMLIAEKQKQKVVDYGKTTLKDINDAKKDIRELKKNKKLTAAEATAIIEELNKGAKDVKAKVKAEVKKYIEIDAKDRKTVTWLVEEIGPKEDTTKTGNQHRDDKVDHLMKYEGWVPGQSDVQKGKAIWKGISYEQSEGGSLSNTVPDGDKQFKHISTGRTKSQAIKNGETELTKRGYVKTGDNTYTNKETGDVVVSHTTSTAEIRWKASKSKVEDQLDQLEDLVSLKLSAVTKPGSSVLGISAEGMPVTQRAAADILRELDNLGIVIEDSPILDALAYIASPKYLASQTPVTYKAILDGIKDAKKTITQVKFRDYTFDPLSNTDKGLYGDLSYFNNSTKAGETLDQVNQRNTLSSWDKEIKDLKLGDTRGAEWIAEKQRTLDFKSAGGTFKVGGRYFTPIDYIRTWALVPSLIKVFFANTAAPIKNKFFGGTIMYKWAMAQGAGFWESALRGASVAIGGPSAQRVTGKLLGNEAKSLGKGIKNTYRMAFGDPTTVTGNHKYEFTPPDLSLPPKFLGKLFPNLKMSPEMARSFEQSYSEQVLQPYAAMADSENSVDMYKLFGKTMTLTQRRAMDISLGLQATSEVEIKVGSWINGYEIAKKQLPFEKSGMTELEYQEYLRTSGNDMAHKVSGAYDIINLGATATWMQQNPYRRLGLTLIKPAIAQTEAEIAILAQAYSKEGSNKDAIKQTAALLVTTAMFAGFAKQLTSIPVTAYSYAEKLAGGTDDPMNTTLSDKIYEENVAIWKYVGFSDETSRSIVDGLNQGIISWVTGVNLSTGAGLDMNWKPFISNLADAGKAGVAIISDLLSGKIAEKNVDQFIPVSVKRAKNTVIGLATGQKPIADKETSHDSHIPYGAVDAVKENTGGNLSTAMAGEASITRNRDYSTPNSRRLVVEDIIKVGLGNNDFGRGFINQVYNDATINAKQDYNFAPRLSKEVRNNYSSYSTDREADKTTIEKYYKENADKIDAAKRGDSDAIDALMANADLPKTYAPEFQDYLTKDYENELKTLQSGVKNFYTKRAIAEALQTVTGITLEMPSGDDLSVYKNGADAAIGKFQKSIKKTIEDRKAMYSK